jgi:flagellar hook assembly protein FlgD
VFSLTFRLAHTARLTWTIRSAKGKIVRRIRTQTYRTGTVLRLRWDGKDSRGHYVRPGRYAFTLTASAHRYSRTARGSVRVLAARST